MYKQERSRSWKEFMRYKKRRSKLDHQLAIYVGVLAMVVLMLTQKDIRNFFVGVEAGD